MLNLRSHLADAYTGAKYRSQSSCFSCLEYFNNPKATAESICEDGWLHTGDLVMIDEDGYIFVLDRLKELIKYKAYQVICNSNLGEVVIFTPQPIDVQSSTNSVSCSVGLPAALLLSFS